MRFKTSDFDFSLPPELIANTPCEPRDASRLLLYRRETKTISHHHVSDLPELLFAQDLLVFNQSRVIPARLPAVDDQGRKVELFLLTPYQQEWRCLAKPGKRVKTALDVILIDGTPVAIRRNEANEFFVRLPHEGPELFRWLEAVGEPPLPPYFKRQANEADKQRYQTIYAKDPGSVAAPTAGLHFTERLFNALHDKGVEKAFVTLHVGYGTFAPIVVEDILEHKMHFESFEIDPQQFEKIERARAEGRRIIPVGTTSMRTLESTSKVGLSGSTNLFITPGFRFEWASGLLTNFHLPQSTLLVLVASLIGLDELKRCYHEAIAQRYRFYSYGDAMLIL